MSLAQNKAIAVKFYEVFDCADVEQGRELIAPNAIGCVMGSEILNGRDALIDYGLMMRNAFPDGCHTFEDIIAEGDKVVTRGTFSGTHQGELIGIAPTGKQVSFSVVHIDRIVEGKIIEHWGQADLLAMLRQLGIVQLPNL